MIFFFLIVNTYIFIKEKKMRRKKKTQIVLVKISNNRHYRKTKAKTDAKQIYFFSLKHCALAPTFKKNEAKKDEKMKRTYVYTQQTMFCFFY